MTTLEEKALAAHASGLNCAQSVVTTYADVLNYDEHLAQSMTSGFGSGMGRLQQTCGAVTGAFMVISISNSQKHADAGDRRTMNISKIQEFNRRFTAIHGSNCCRSLLGCDMNTEEGRELYVKNGLSAKVCNRCIADAVRLVDELIK